MESVALHPTFAVTDAERRTLDPHGVHVWAVPLDGDDEALLAVLSPAERDRVAKLRILDHRRRYAIAHGALRTILAAYVGVEPTAVQFETGRRGKPYCTNAGAPFFNLSRSGQLALIGVARQELGVDLEKVRHLESLLDIAERHFSAAEYAALLALPAAAQLRAFYRVWTTKEAFVKALGGGLAPLDGFDVTVDGACRILAFRDRDDAPADWALADVSPGPEFAAAVALPARAPAIETFALRLPGR